MDTFIILSFDADFTGFHKCITVAHEMISRFNLLWHVHI